MGARSARTVRGCRRTRRRDATLIGLRWSRPALTERIERRVTAMMAAGLLDEVARLAADRDVADGPPGARLQGAARPPRRRRRRSTRRSPRSPCAPASSPSVRSGGSVATRAYAGTTSSATRWPRWRRWWSRLSTHDPTHAHQAPRPRQRLPRRVPPPRRRPAGARPPGVRPHARGRRRRPAGGRVGRRATRHGWRCSTPTAAGPR